MKLHFTYNLTDLSQALSIAEQTAEFADTLGIGSLLIYKEGINAIKMFVKTFPNKDIFVEAQIIEKADEAVKMMADAGAKYISLLAGAHNNTIKKAVNAAQPFNTKIALDLLDAAAAGQSALDAKTLGVDFLILHRPPQDINTNLDAEWHNVHDNTKLPIFITGKIDDSDIKQIAELKPHGIMIGSAITKADNPAKMAHHFKSLIP